MVMTLSDHLHNRKRIKYLTEQSNQLLITYKSKKEMVVPFVAKNFAIANLSLIIGIEHTK
jgi:hypothetical protein